MSPGRAESIRKTSLLSYLLESFDSTIFTGIFATLFSAAYDINALVFFQEVGKLIAFPITALISVIQAALAWRQAYLHNWSKLSIGHAALQTITAAIIIALIISAVLVTAASFLAIPAVIVFGLSFKVGFNIVSALNHWYHYAIDFNEKSRQHHFDKALENTFAAITLGLASASIIGMVLTFNPMFAILGVIAGIIATSFAIYKVWSLRQAASPAPTLDSDDGMDSTYAGLLRPEGTLRQRAFAKMTPDGSSAGNVPLDPDPAPPAEPRWRESRGAEYTTPPPRPA